MTIRISFGNRWFYLCLFQQRFTSMYYIQMECGHNSTRNLLTIWRTDSKNERRTRRAGIFMALGSRKTKALKRFEREHWV